MRTRKLLLKAEEISKLIGKVEQRGYTLVPLNLHYKNGRIKLDFALGRGKKLYDKRDTSREKDWQREKERLMKHDTRRETVLSRRYVRMTKFIHRRQARRKPQ